MSLTLNETSVSLEWTKNGHAEVYNVSCEDEPECEDSQIIYSNQTLQVVFHGLTPGKMYNFSVVAVSGSETSIARRKTITMSMYSSVLSHNY